VKIARTLLDQIIDHARRDAPDECCGVVSTEAGEARAVFALENLAGHELGAIYHSHTRTAPYPSQTDVNFSVNWPGVEWVIVGLKEDEADVRSYLIEGGQVREVPVEVV
jgi:[CysO sulfur-carrier protein]-S-L-cysteine hydrolase